MPLFMPYKKRIAWVTVPGLTKKEEKWLNEILEQSLALSYRESGKYKKIQLACDKDEDRVKGVEKELMSYSLFCKTMGYAPHPHFADLARKLLIDKDDAK